MTRSKATASKLPDDFAVFRTETRLQNTPALNLSDWLDVSWFYPEGFAKEFVLETPRSLVVVGASLVYKFFRPEYVSGVSHQPPTFADSWRLACEEILDNREFAPELYLGVRLLRWIDDEPHWMTELRGRELDPLAPPAGADEVALVMRRIPTAARLSDKISQDEEIDLDRLNSAIHRLAKYHRRRSRTSTEETGHLFSAGEVERRAVARLERFIESYGTYIDPFSNLALGEVKSCLQHFLRENLDLLHRRSESGLVIDLHGGLSAHNVCLEPLSAEGRAVPIVGRPALHDQPRVGDVLLDLAALSTDLTVRGAGMLAAELESKYFERHPEAVNENLFRFYLALHAASRAVELFERSSEDYLGAATDFLAFSLRCSLNLRGSFLLAIGGSDIESCQALAKSISELVPAVIIQHHELFSAEQISELPDDWLFEKMLREARVVLAEGTGAVLLWPCNRSEEQLQLFHAARDSRAPCLLVCHSPNSAERLRAAASETAKREAAKGGWPRRISALRGATADLPGCPPLPYSGRMSIESALPLPELALDVLRQLSAGKRESSRQQNR